MNDKSSLLASLTEDQVGEVFSGEQDLFGDVNEHHQLASQRPTGHTTVVGASLPPVLPETTTLHDKTGIEPRDFVVSDNLLPTQSNDASEPLESRLFKSGLLEVGDDTGCGVSGGGGGLFDDVDAEEQKKAEEEKRLREQEEEHKRISVDAERKLLQDVEDARTQQIEQDRLMTQQQQQNLNGMDQMQHRQQLLLGESVNISGMGEVPTYQHQPPIVQNTAMSPVLPGHQMQGINLNDNSGFYRQHGSSTALTYGNQPQNAYSGISMPQNSYFYYGTQQQQQQQQQPYHGQVDLSSTTQAQPSATAGMHNSVQYAHLGNVRKIHLVKPPVVAPLYTHIHVNEPMLIQTQSFLISSPPYWSYQIMSQLAGNQGTWLVRRRFRHVVALEERLRLACPGSILPPRPDKHAIRAIEEATTQQSAEFAVQRAKELEQYLNQLAKHPAAGQCQALRLFLGLQDDIGTAWAECSSNALTRLGAVGAGVSMKVAETTNLTSASAPAHEWEEDAELLGLCSSENLRLGAVSQAVPKLEGAVILLREQGDASGALGMELSKASKMLDMDFKMCDVLSTGLLRQGRRTKRLALEMSAAMESFLHQYKLVRYEKMAMHDRRQALQKKAKERGRADSRAFYLSQQQNHLQLNGHLSQLNQLEQNAIHMDSGAIDVVGEAEEIGARLKSEIHRVSITRRTEWNTSMKTVASSMKEACSERAAIWESSLEAFQNIYKHEGLSEVNKSHIHPSN
jgi:hypothetical protein